jgi:hypothetical protein
MLETPSVTQLSQVINHAIAPAFILGAVSGFIASAQRARRAPKLDYHRLRLCASCTIILKSELY